MSLSVDTSLLKIFIACVDTGSISGAARTLGRTQPTVTERLSRLEDIVGEALLVRSSKGVVLTPPGERFLPYARRIIALSDEALSAVGGSTVRGERIAIGLLEDLSTGRLAGMLRDLRLEDGSSLELVALADQSLRLALDDGRVDLALCATAGLSLPVLRSWLEPMVWVAAPGFDLSRRPLPLLVCSPPCLVRERILQSLDPFHVNWRVALESTTHLGLQAAVAGGIGVAAMLARFLPENILAVDPLAELPSLPAVEIGLVRSHASKSPKKMVKTVSEAMIEMMAS